ncbi:MAG: anti-anti-sigma factor [Ignavibacteriae bacterium HGW-Ignavibacteriae-1]|jgi:anti-anti-sigma factor|nr:MAG: anti-anti-sigma factor [Ignavibacteriae bacterium HGW-Ignavibacteriae-1]
MNIVFSHENEIEVAKLSGRIDTTNSDEVQTELLGKIASGAKKLAIDFSEVTYISSAGLRAILSSVKEITKKEGKLAIFAMQDNIKDVFDMSGFSAIMNILPDYNATKEFMK